MDSTFCVRSLLLRGAKRSAQNTKGETPSDLISSDLSEKLQKELHEILKEPWYLECFMVKTPLVPLRRNVKT